MVIGDSGALFENYVAVSLLKGLYEIEDQHGKPARLHYLKIKEGREVDFCAVINDAVEYIIEAKESDQALHAGLRYFCDRYPFFGIQLVRAIRDEQQPNNITIRRSVDFLKKPF